MKNNIKQLVKQWFEDSKEYALDHYALCSEWLSTYVMNSCQDFLLSFFTDKEINETDVETLRLKALVWIGTNADDIVNFDDYR